jgi:hypothetical protein
MLDSLVRVSRRVGGAANLLTTEMQTVSNMDTCYTCLLNLPVDFKAKNTGLEHKERTSPMPSV